MLRCLWNADANDLVGSVRGSRGRTYTTTVRLRPVDDETWRVESGLCSCPIRAACKHVAALVIAAGGAAEIRASMMRCVRRHPRIGASRWRRYFPRFRPPIRGELLGDRAEPIRQRA
ncbi:SWIM zinc finger family protein [Mycobacterium sp.]|uniref:SWIM zinc finger family protein n=1 Tax=Mycobacterium sp. TaxID=1785 RepID=UPI00345BB83C